MGTTKISCMIFKAYIGYKLLKVGFAINVLQSRYLIFDCLFLSLTL